MKQEGLSYFTDTHLTILGFFLFLFSFLAVYFWTYRKSAKSHYEEIGKIPLEQGVQNER